MGEGALLAIPFLGTRVGVSLLYDSPALVRIEQRFAGWRRNSGLGCAVVSGREVDRVSPGGFDGEGTKGWR